MDESTQSKVCGKCGATKAAGDFHRRQNSRDGLAPWCKGCVKSYDRARRERDGERLRQQSSDYYYANREQVRAQQNHRRATDDEFRERESQRGRERYLANREAAIEKARQWRIANPEKFAEHKERWRKRNPEKVREWARISAARSRERDPEAYAARRKAWADNNRDLLRATRNAWASANREKVQAHRHRRRAQVRATFVGDVDLAAKWIEQAGCCGICAAPLDRTLRYPHPLSPSVDHIIPLSKGGGHTQDNLAWTCLVCNLAKGSDILD